MSPYCHLLLYGPWSISASLTRFFAMSKKPSTLCYAGLSGPGLHLSGLSSTFLTQPNSTLGPSSMLYGLPFIAGRHSNVSSHWRAAHAIRTEPCFQHIPSERQSASNTSMLGAQYPKQLF